jgi:hypothetical protein
VPGLTPQLLSLRLHTLLYGIDIVVEEVCIIIIIKPLNGETCRVVFGVGHRLGRYPSEEPLPNGGPRHFLR